MTQWLIDLFNTPMRDLSLAQWFVTVAIVLLIIWAGLALKELRWRNDRNRN